MKPSLRISFRFIQPFPLFHGRGDADEPEWPPSPMRAFQALLNAASLRTRGKPLPPEVRSALQVIEVLRPSIVAPRATLSSVGHRAYVPHNQTDLVTAAWDRGNVDASIASHRIEKDFRPHGIETVGDDLPTIHYLYPLDATNADPAELLSAIRPSARSIHCLGWGIDQVVADATLVDSSSRLLAGERWSPTPRGGRRLRVHRKGSLDALAARHEKFLNRLINGDWTPVPPVSEIDQVRYCRETDPIPRPHAVFKLLDPNEDPARYPHAKLMHIAGMVRHAAIKMMANAGADADFVNHVIRGKRDPSSADEHRQISYVPLPSIGHEHADAMIRNVMIVAPIGMDRELADLARRIDGQPLQPEGDFDQCRSDSRPTGAYRAELRLFTPPEGKFIDKLYLATSQSWHTVTPVILPGYDDHRPAKTIKLIQRALSQSGIGQRCEFEWGALPNFPSCLPAYKYDRNKRPTGYFRPDHLKDYTVVHLRIRFETPFSGPLVIGAGRHCGFGLFATAE
ncbi:MAG TPA: type I-U CRISPR-associated protein Csb2 [Beijerinckiaceae bacterium]|nr:type I-U CRISPR-associated protein Csb2 [Beijerinckiaceae bacterium]